LSRRPQVFITRKIPSEALEVFSRAGVEHESNPEDRQLRPQEIIDRTRDKQGLLCLLEDQLSASVLEALAKNQIEGIANLAVGYNNIDIASATRLKIPVTNTPDVLTETTADLAWTLICAVARRVVEGDRFVRSGAWKGWGLLDWLGSDIQGSTLGILGAGRIGTALARRARAFRMKILYVSRTPHKDLDQTGAQKVDLKDLLGQSDFVSVHLPLNPETRHFMGTKEFKMMKPTAYLINTARGPIVDEDALAQALESKTIAGAGLDVYEKEPKVHQKILKLPQVTLLPHVGSATRKTRVRMAALAATNLVAMVQGQRPPNLVNPEIYEK